jgi:SAM-dependent methyltransferase
MIAMARAGPSSQLIEKSMSNFVAPPEHLLMQIANNPSVKEFSNSFQLVREAAISYCCSVGYDFRAFETILDFGCGVGRFLFAFDGHLGPHQRLLGCDINLDCAAWCSNNIRFAEIVHSPTLPPLPYADNSIDYINAVSVFTHLTVDVQFRWAWEIHRILRPGGIIAMTTNGLAHIPFLLSLQAQLFPVSDFRVIGDDGLLMVLAADQSPELEGQREVVTIYSKRAIEQAFSPLEMLYHQPLSNLAGGQSFSILRKQRSGRSVEPILQDTNEPIFRFSAQELATEFRAYVSFDEDAYSVHDERIDYAIASDSGKIHEIRGTPLTLNRLFKGRHLAPISFWIPATFEPFTVHLGRAPDSNLPKMKFSHPRLIVTK